MGWVKDNFFGGAAKDAAKQQVAAVEKASGLQQQYYNQARQDVLGLFPNSYQQLAQGFQQAADVLGQGRASSSSVLQQAFGNANQTIQSGADAQMAALLGRQQAQPAQAQQMQRVDTPFSQPQQQMPFSQKVPQTAPIQQAPQSAPAQRPVQNQPLSLAGETIDPVTGRPVDTIGSAGGLRGVPGRDLMAVASNQAPEQFTGMPVDMSVRGGDRIPTINQSGAMQNMTANPITGQPQVTGAVQPPAVQNTTTAPINPVNLGPAQTVQGGDFTGIGLSGAESALQAGLQGQLGAYSQAQQQASGTLTDAAQGQLSALGQGFGAAQGQLYGGLRQGLDLLGQGYNQAANTFGQGINTLQQGMDRGVGAIQAGTDRGLGFLEQGVGRVEDLGQQAVGRIDQSTGQAVNFLNPYAQTGQQALNQEAALSGAMGAEAQQQAINQFIESPGQQFLRERQEQALLRNASATGGLRGGATLTALQEQAMGIAATQQQQQLENLRNLAGRGQQAAGQQGAFAQQGGQAAAGAMQNTAGQVAGLRGQQGNMAQQGGIASGNLIGQMTGQQASMYGQLGGIGANMAGQGAGMAQQTGQIGANLAAQQGQLGANVLGQTGQQIAGLQNQFGQLAGGAMGQAGQQLSGLRNQAGMNAANLLGNQTNQLAGNQLQLGQLLAGLDQSTAANLANLLTQGATVGSQSQMQLATLLANLATGQGTSLANLAVGAGNAQAAGTLGQTQGIQGGIGMLIGGAQEAAKAGLFSSDRNLKDNITKLFDGAVNLYSWTWKHIDAIPEHLRGALSIGVIAQEVEEKFPECVVSANGYLAVNYTELAKRIAE